MLKKLFVKIQCDLACDEGATAIEYGLLLLVAAGVAALITPIRTQVVAVYQTVLTAITP